MTFGNVREVRVSHKLSRDDKGKLYGDGDSSSDSHVGGE